MEIANNVTFSVDVIPVLISPVIVLLAYKIIIFMEINV